VKLAVVWPSYVYNEERIGLADACFRSVMRTLAPSETPALVILVKPTGYIYPWGELARTFDLFVLDQMVDGTEFKGIDQPLIHGTDEAFKRGAEYVVHLNDDSLVHPRWLLELEALIGRHPGARAWSVYRSAHTAVHAVLRDDGQDLLVRSINGNGLTIAAADWKDWGEDWHQYAWPDDPRGAGVVTLDYRHYVARAGERWVTRRSYIEHTGRRGTHCQPGIPEWAVDFAGTEE
jgi:hypothetical protein